VQHKVKTKEDLVKHFQKRCIERIGYIISQKELKKDLTEGNLKLIKKVSCSRTMFQLPQRYRDNFVVVYDKLRHNFVTVYENIRKEAQSV